MDYKKRCEECTCLIKKNGVWCCDECFGQKCEEVTDCPFGLDEEKLEEYEKLNKVKVKHDAKAKKPRKQATPRTVKVCDEKKELFNEIYSNLQEIYGENAQIVKENKLITVKIGEKLFKIDVIQQRESKK